MLPQAYTQEVREEQLKLLALTSYLFASVGSTSVGLIALDMQHNITVSELALCGAIPACYAALLGLTVRWRRRGDGRAYLRRSVILMLLLGTLWGMLMERLSVLGDVGQRRLAASLMIGLAASPMMASPLSVALAFWLPTFCASVFMICVSQPPFDPYLLLGTVGYLFFVLAGVFLLNRSLLERSLNRAELARQNETISMFLRNFEENASDWEWETDAFLRFQRVTRRFTQVSGLAAEELHRQPMTTFVGDRSPENLILFRALEERASFRELLIAVVAAGEERWWQLTGLPRFDTHGKFQGYRGIGTDVTVARRSEQAVLFLASHDNLTGLLNRRQCMAAMEDAAKDGIAGFGLVLLDLDGFKAVNDTFGHEIGDELLKMVSGRLKTIAPPGGTVARLGGDEFALVFPGMREGALATFAQQVVAELSRSMAISDLRLVIGVSVGLTRWPQDGPDIAGVLRRADLALYVAKSSGRGTWRFFNTAMAEAYSLRLALQSDLRLALEESAFTIVYQPIINLRSGDVVAFEALLRWHHPTRGPISPSEFIPIAERAGLISRIGAFVLRQACLSATHWPDRCRLSVNMSPLQLRDLNVLGIVDEALASSGLSPARLELEFTEHAVLHADVQTRHVMEALRERGIRLILDDFGSGYSSFSSLRDLEFDGVKLDASFVRSLHHDHHSAAIVAAISALASEMGLPLTAEGIETPEQVSQLAEFNVEQGQGYLFGRPMSQAAVLDRLAVK